MSEISITYRDGRIINYFGDSYERDGNVIRIYHKGNLKAEVFAKPEELESIVI